MGGIVRRSTLPVQLWADGQGRARQLRLELPLPFTGSTSALQGGSLTMTLDFYDFGALLNIKAPPAGEVYDVTSRLANG